TPLHRSTTIMLHTTTLKSVAPTTLLLTQRNRPPHTISVYASPWSSPSKTQHSLPGGRYPLPGPDFHRLDRASFLAHQCVNFKPLQVEERDDAAAQRGRLLYSAQCRQSGGS